MPEVYTPQTWTNGVAGNTPLSAARLQHIEDGIEALDDEVAVRAHQAQVFPYTTPIISGITDALSTSLSTITGANVYFDEAKFSVPVGYTLQCRLMGYYTGCAVSDVIEADIFNTSASTVAVAASTKVADSTGLVEFAGNWVEYPDTSGGIIRAAVRDRNQTAVRGNTRNLWLETQIIVSP